MKQALHDGVPPAPVLGDSVYGDNAAFRSELRGLRLEFFLQVDPRKHKGWVHAVQTEVKQTRRHVMAETPPAQTLAELAQGFAEGDWRKGSWLTAGGRRRTTRLAWRPVFLQHGLRQAGGELEEVWLIVDWPAGDPEPYHYYLAHFHRPPTQGRCLKLSRSRWHIGQSFQRSKDNLGLDHLEGRSWRGFHHHLVLSAIAYLFVLTVYLRGKNFWCDVGTDPASDPALAGEGEPLLHLLRNEI